MPGTLYLIPNLLGEADPAASLTAVLIDTVRQLKHFIVEDEKSARRFLKLCGVMPPFEGISMHVLDKHTSHEEKMNILKEVRDMDSGMLSDAGCPAVADPGSDFVRLAHAHQLMVRPLVGPSSILMALMASGFNGQAFTFHGYLPVQQGERMHKLRELENLAESTAYTQLFIETPFRNQNMLEDILKVCKPATYLSVACDITLSTEEIHTATVADWAKRQSQLKGRPAVFAIWSEKKADSGKKPKYAGRGR